MSSMKMICQLIFGIAIAHTAQSNDSIPRTEDNQSYYWIKYNCASPVSDPRNVQLVTGYQSTGYYAPTNWQSPYTLQTGLLPCPQINVFYECGPAGVGICAVRYLGTEIEPVTPAQNVNIRPKVGVTFAGHEIQYCARSLPYPPCIQY